MMPGGRPTSYEPAFCERVEEFMALGYSKMAAAGNVGVCYNTLKAWMAEHPEFLTAVKRGEARRTQILECSLLAAETGPQVTSRIFALKNAAPDEWRDVHRQEVTGADGGPVRTQDVTPADKLKARLDAITNRTAGEPAGE